MNISPGTFTLFVLAIGLMLAALVRVGEFMVVDMSRRGKARIVWLDADGKKPSIEFHAVKDGQITVGKGDDARTYILEAEAMYPGRYRTWVMEPKFGWNFRAPTRVETVDADKRLAVLSVSNPSSYHKAMARNEWADALKANEDKQAPSWVPMAIAVGGVLVLGLFGMLGFIVYRVSSASAAAGGP